MYFCHFTLLFQIIYSFQHNYFIKNENQLKKSNYLYNNIKLLSGIINISSNS